MNTVTIASIKRSGMNAIDAALAHGPAFVMKRNRVAGVVISPNDYAALLKNSLLTKSDEQAKLSTAQWMLQQPMRSGGLNTAQMKVRLEQLHEGWNER